MARSTATPHPLTRGTLFELIAEAHLCAILLLLLGTSPTLDASEERTLSFFDVAPPPPPASIPPTPPKRLTIARRPAGGSPRSSQVMAPPADPRPPSRFNTPLTDDAPLTPIAVAGDLPGTGIDLTLGSGSGDGNGEGAMRVGADWIYKPLRELRYYWPRTTGARRVSATVSLDCILPQPGKAERCTVVGEQPAGLGFGEAALGLSRHVRIRPVMRDGRVVTNATVRVPVTFKTLDVPVP